MIKQTLQTGVLVIGAGAAGLPAALAAAEAGAEVLLVNETIGNDMAQTIR